MGWAPDIAQDFLDLERTYERLRELAALPAQLAETRQVAVSGWSALEHVSHVALANELIVRNLDALASERGQLIVATGEPIDGALAILESGRIPRGRAQSPRMVRPPVRIDRALLGEWLAGAAQGFARHAQDPSRLLAAPGRIPHQLLGPLSAQLWVRFAAVHTRHHIAIAEEVLAA